MGPASHSPGPGLTNWATGDRRLQTLLSPRGSGSRDDWAGVPTANALPDWEGLCVGMWLQKSYVWKGCSQGRDYNWVLV